ncbi:MAG: MBL fold metallo-hydrolase [Actinomycetia bacterium]|nr:MBL fold metallo-hydrolase [Actinomycetes bacterium]
MKLTVVGCSGSYPGPTSAASAYLVEHDGFRLVVDLGNGALGPLQRYVDPAEVDAVLLSHLHVDHCIDVCSYYVALQYRPGGFDGLSIPVHGPAGAGPHLARAYGTPDAEANLQRVFDFRTLDAGVGEIGPFRVTTARMAHPVPCFGVRLEADGVVLAYSADTAPTDALVHLAEGADLLLAEASFLDGDDNPPGLHLTGREAGEHAARAGVGRLVVTHVPPWHDPQRALAEAQGAFAGPVELAAPGATHSW